MGGALFKLFCPVGGDDLYGGAGFGFSYSEVLVTGICDLGVLAGADLDLVGFAGFDNGRDGVGVFAVVGGLFGDDLVSLTAF